MPAIALKLIDDYDRTIASHDKEIRCSTAVASYPHLRWMLSVLRTCEDPIMSARWFGFVQGVLVADGLVVLSANNEFTSSGGGDVPYPY